MGLLVNLITPDILVKFNKRNNDDDVNIKRRKTSNLSIEYESGTKNS
jgi:hypothetical protein